MEEQASDFFFVRHENSKPGPEINVWYQSLLTNPYSADNSIKRPSRADTKISCIWLISNRTELTIVVLDYVL